MKGLHYVPAGETERWIAALRAQGTDTLAVFRFADDNDSAAYSFGTLWRICKTRQEVAEMVERSNKQQYMGRKRHKWYAAVKESPDGSAAMTAIKWSDRFRNEFTRTYAEEGGVSGQTESKS